MKNNILITKDYSQFKFVKGNRAINYTHVNNLVESIKEKDLQMPIIVDENMNVVDGQHRLEAYRLLKKPVHYIVKKNFNLTDIRQINSVQKSWTPITYMNSFKDLGVEDYVYLEWFVRTYKFGIIESCQMLTNGSQQGKKDAIEFKLGNFKITNLEKGKKMAIRINKIGEYFQYYKKRTFVAAMIFSFKHKEFEWSRFEQKLENFSSMLKNQGSRNDFLINIEKLYNHKTSIDKKIRFDLNMKV
ncbi:MAG: putative ParB [Prokaryotic dsDNA virus sp.]|jgi:hypothetical protein|nr:MAG: putative ParB [Prokaryotic dsDNA virus sp.]QDP67333.1 MAG: putative ParB [Prokaryotic dsDNA virus sp.]|tara:strand:- start:2908 stop:3639 length:732 start_codon:yes stop_codon:yes gene_type:complete